MKYNLKKLGLFFIAFTLIIGFAVSVSAASNTILIYGEKLTDSQRTEVRDILNISDNEAVEEYDVTGQDYADFINGNPNANMYSSARIVLENEGAGLTVTIVTPENITEVTGAMYENALLTAGAENATVDIVSPVRVSGHSALTGIYKAYDVEGEELDKERMELANEELNVATDLAENEDISQEEVSTLLSEIKQMIADQNPATREDVEQIVSEQLEKLEINLNEEDRQMLINLFDKMRNLDIDFGAVRSQLEDIANSIADKADELGLDAGFWEKVANFFSEIFASLSDFLSGLFN
ncbi:DUF1002 domain-containing protein [Oceanobacillus saliphilus]|uniref:DUF1002 domain-containing protein n=1 Tax=Oceanobacillus saliphilus TaxID=2925834 RepID=UPI00201E3DBF|nr:DUF1002 domain-containing protein [Oceanobacillus saliphilus]